jgi:hypothetical protein
MSAGKSCAATGPAVTMPISSTSASEVGLLGKASRFERMHGSRIQLFFVVWAMKGEKRCCSLVLPQEGH